MVVPLFDLKFLTIFENFSIGKIFYNNKYIFTESGKCLTYLSFLLSSLKSTL